MNSLINSFARQKKGDKTQFRVCGKSAASSNVMFYFIFVYFSISVFKLHQYQSLINHLSIASLCAAVFGPNGANKCNCCLRLCQRLGKTGASLEFRAAARSGVWHHHPYFMLRLVVIRFASSWCEQGGNASPPPCIIMIFLKLDVFKVVTFNDICRNAWPLFNDG